MLRPNDGKVIYHKFALFVNDADSVTSWTEETFDVKTLWPEGYIAVVDNLTAMLQATADFAATMRMSYTITGYQKKVSANQLASLLVAQTQS
jgi:alpha-ketoglutarate-dependent taurine dioxygenase